MVNMPICNSPPILHRADGVPGINRKPLAQPDPWRRRYAVFMYLRAIL